MVKIISAFILSSFFMIGAWAAEVNTASAQELTQLKGVGSKTVELIIDEREKRNFKDWPDFIQRVKGIGEKKAQKLSVGGLTVAGKAYKSQTLNAQSLSKNSKKPKADKKLKPTISKSEH